MDGSLKRVGPSTWSCLSCTLQNEDSVEKCQLCGLSNPKNPHKKIKVSTSLEPSIVKDIPRGILCPLCTFDNKLEDSKCGMCSQSLFQDSYDGPLGKEQEPNLDLIECPACHFRNDKFYHLNCVSCEAPMNGEKPMSQIGYHDQENFIEQLIETKICYICTCEISVVLYPQHTKNCSQSLDMIQRIKKEYPQDFTTDQCHYCYETLEETMLQTHYKTCKEKRMFFDDVKTFGKMTHKQIQAMKFMYSSSEDKHYRAKPLIVKKIRSLGHTYKDIEAVQHYMENYAPIIVHIHVARYMHLFVKDTHYRNQFQTMTSSGSLSSASRTQWQNRMFSKKYSGASHFERVKYGVINLTNDPNGVQCCAGYGSSYFLLKEDVRKRCTFTDTDSSSSAAQIGVLKFGFHVLQKLSDVEIKGLIQGAKAMQVSSAIVSTYKEIQIHGPLDFANDIQRLYVNQNQLLDPTILGQIKEFSNKFKVDYEVFKPIQPSPPAPTLFGIPSPIFAFPSPSLTTVPRKHPKKRKY